MNKKILIGSIIAICILIGVSFTSVVGYRSVTSDVKASPLFGIRCRKAIDRESEELRCEYVGKGDEISLSIPKRDIRNVYLQKAIQILNGVDEEKYIIILKQVKNILKNYDDDIIISKLTETLGELNRSLKQNIDITDRCFSNVQCTVDYHCGPTLGFDIIDCHLYFTLEDGLLLGFDCIKFILILIPSIIIIGIFLFITLIIGFGITGFPCYPP